MIRAHRLRADHATETGNKQDDAPQSGRLRMCELTPMSALPGACQIHTLGGVGSCSALRAESRHSPFRLPNSSAERALPKAAPFTLSVGRSASLRGQDETVETSLHHLITPLAQLGITDRRWHPENVPNRHTLALNPFDTGLAPIDVCRKRAFH